MRYLILHRERALAAFALTYYCHVNCDREAHLQEISQLEDPRAQAGGKYGLRNGQTVKIPLEDGENRFFVGIYTQEKCIITPETVIEPGQEDVYYKIVTDFDGNKRISYRIEPMGKPEK